MLRGRVINSNGGIYKVVLEDKSIITVKARGKLRSCKAIAVNQKAISRKASLMEVKNSPKVGDFVFIENDMIDHYEKRMNEMVRPDIANVDQILLVFAAKEPDFSFYLLDLFIVNILRQRIKPVIVISKIDKLTSDELNDLKGKLAYYEQLGYQVFYVNSKQNENISEVAKVLENKVTVFSGQTGAGKSTLINAIIPGFNLQTQEISQALGRGKHTTRESNLYEYHNGYIGDTPGFSKLDVLGVLPNELANLFVEFSQYHCYFKDCNHTEFIKGCAIHQAAINNDILPSRYENFLKMYKQITDGGKQK